MVLKRNSYALAILSWVTTNKKKEDMKYVELLGSEYLHTRKPVI